MSRALGVESGNQLDVVGASDVLEIEDLKTHFFTASGVVKTVDGAASSITSPDVRLASSISAVGSHLALKMVHRISARAGVSPRIPSAWRRI